MNQQESLIPDKSDYLIENNPAAIISLDPSLNIIQANRAFIQLSGYPSETIKGMNIRSFRILQSEGGSLTDVTERKQVVSGSVIVQFPSGKRYMEYRYIPVFSSQGDITGIGVVYIDKTSEMHDKERSSVIIEKNPGGICIFNRELQITQVNEAFLHMSGYKREDLTGKQITLFDIINRKGARPDDVIEKKERMTTDIHVSFPVGRRYLTGSYTPILDEHGLVTEVIEFFIDCTKEKEAARDILAVAEKARHGDFSDRITSHYYEGDLADIANEINSMLDYIAAPLGEIVRISEKFASGIFNARFSDKIGVKGDFLQVRDALNTISDSIHSSLEILAKTCDSYAQGDFTSQLNDMEFADSGFKKMKQSLMDVGRSMGSALHLISEQTKMLEKTTLDTSKTIIHVSESASQVAASADVVKTNTERCQVGIKQIFSAMEDLSIAVDGVAQKVEKAASFSSDTNHLCKKGEDLTRIAEAGIEGITLSTSEVDAMIQEIKNQMAKIDKIVLLITEISNQTNLLALNAAIEAARAGDAGRGFAVVATEVKSLAQESKSSAEEITGLIRSLQSTSDRAGTVMKAALNEVEKGGSAVTQSIQVFSEVIHSVNEISTIMEEIAVASEEQAAGVEEITASVSEVKHYVEETAVESDRTAAASRESSHATDQIADKMHEVERAVTAVTSKVQEFRYL